MTILTAYIQSHTCESNPRHASSCVFQRDPKSPPDGKEEQDRGCMRPMQSGKKQMLRLSSLQAVCEFKQPLRGGKQIGVYIQDELLAVERGAREDG